VLNGASRDLGAIKCLPYIAYLLTYDTSTCDTWVIVDDIK